MCGTIDKKKVVVVDKNWIAHTCVTNTIKNTTDNRNNIIIKKKRTRFTCFKK